MAKVLISTLGVGPIKEDVPDRKYRPALYKFDQKQAGYKTPFVSAALVQELRIEKVFYIGTARSMWEEVYHYFTVKAGEEVNVDYWIELGEKVGRSNYRNKGLVRSDLNGVNKAIDDYLKKINGSEGGSYCFIMDYGLNEKELWSNFDFFMQISEMLNDGDEVYLDITHSFRSIPLFMYLMMDFIQTLKMKEIYLTGVYYGMLDIVGELQYAPIVNLKPLFELSAWIRGTYEFINYGNGYLIAEMLEDKKASEDIRNISELININYLAELRKKISSLDSYLNNGVISKSKVLNYLMPYFDRFMKRFRRINSNSEFQIELARWYFENNRYANGYICLEEAIINRFIEIYRNKDSKIKINEGTRKKIKNLIGKLEYNNSDPVYSKICEIYKEIRKIRNQIAHAGLDNDIFFKDAIKKSDNYTKKVYKWVISNKNLYKITEKYSFYSL